MNNKFKLEILLNYFDLPVDEIGGVRWWGNLKRIGAPFITKQEEGTCLVLFLWQDPLGSEKTSDTASVLLNVNSLTNHNSWEPVCLQRENGSDVWFGQLSTASNWRASYSFIPIKSNQLPEIAQKNSSSSREEQRKWWLDVVKNQTYDPLNQLPSIVSSWGNGSALHLPNADTELGWSDWEKGILLPISTADICIIKWTSPSLDNQRDCLLFSTAVDDAPLVILLDGQKWGEESGALSVLQHLTDMKKIAPAHYLLIPSINNQVRWQELSCYRPFWLAVINELLPLIQKKLIQSECTASDYLIAGQSLGGLSALYAGLYFPDYFSKIISLSGSFWWPEIDRMRDPEAFKSANPEWLNKAPKNSLADLIMNNDVSVLGLKIYQTIGLSEKDLCVYNDITYQVIQQKGGVVYYEKVCGGHDWLSWRASLVNGLIKLMPSPL